MSDYRRFRIEGGTFFFTVNLADRQDRILVERIDLLRAAFAKTRAERPFKIDSIVILPDHLHSVWTLPAGDSDFSVRWSHIKARFTHALGLSRHRSQSKRAKRERGIWQRRFWEHAIRNEADYWRCVEYCWNDPVRHGLAKTASGWAASSIHREIRAGTVAANWSGGLVEGNFGERRELA